MARIGGNQQSTTDRAASARRRSACVTGHAGDTRRRRWSGRKGAELAAACRGRKDTPRFRPEHQRRGRRRRWLLPCASDSEARLQVAADRTGSKHIGGFRIAERGGPACAGHGGRSVDGRRCGPLAICETGAVRDARPTLWSRGVPGLADVVIDVADGNRASIGAASWFSAGDRRAPRRAPVASSDCGCVGVCLPAVDADRFGVGAGQHSRGAPAGCRRA